MGVRVFTPPFDFPRSAGPKIFLAGTIENGASRDWQSDFIDAAAKRNEDILIFNPRKKDWNSSIDPAVESAELTAQIEWELSKLEAVDAIALYLDPTSKSPISLLEFGLYCSPNTPDLQKLVVFCPEGFYRRQNVLITAKRYNVTVVSSPEELLDVSVALAKRNFERTAAVKNSVHVTD
jgi:hypothetical protein